MPTTAHHLAQLNIARLLAPIDDPRIAEFVARLDEINHLAERSPGFVWRLQDDSGNATHLSVIDDPLVIANLTVWTSVAELDAFTYRSEHRTVLAKRFDWFERWNGPSVVLWWIAVGELPTIGEALARLKLLTERGPTPAAFTFKQPFDPPA